MIYKITNQEFFIILPTNIRVLSNIFPDSCPVSSINSKRIGVECYFLGPTRLSIDAAQQFCLSHGAKLAEPNLTLADITALSNGFQTIFADEIQTSNS